MKTILVAGGAGFLGSHMVETLLREGARVYIIDDFSTSSPHTTEHIRSHQNAVFVHHDILEPVLLEEHFDELYNFACPASPPQYQKDPIRTMRINTQGVINLLEVARRDSSLFFQASTSEVYGNPLVHPQTEAYLGNVRTIGPRACYDEGKRCAETLCFDYARHYGVDIKVVRIFNTYGPRMGSGDGRVVPNFIVQALTGKPLTVYGKGEQTRSFCFVDDLIAGIYAFVRADRAQVGPANVGNPHEITMLELAEHIIRLTNSTSTIVYQPLPIDDPERRCPDIGYIKGITGWEPRVSLVEGLTKTIAYFRKELAI